MTDQKKATHPDMAVDTEGRPLPYSVTEVRRIIAQAIDSGSIRLVIIEMPDGDVAVQIFNEAGGPTPKLLGVLEQAVKAYRDILYPNPKFSA